MRAANDYLFDLQGYLLLKGALSANDVAEINAAIDHLPRLKPGEWHGQVHCQKHHPRRGINWQNIIEGGEPFERLIDHPSWISLVRRYVDTGWGLFIDEAFFNIRGPGEAINVHSGGHIRATRSQFRFHNNEFFCGQINVLVAMTDIGPGDGATVIIPGSHKSNLPHPGFPERYEDLMGTAMDGMLGGVELHMQAGDAALFVDALAHGSVARVNHGERRILVYRYGPGWGQSRFGFEPSEALIARLTPERRRIVQPVSPSRPPV